MTNALAVSTLLRSMLALLTLSSACTSDDPGTCVPITCADAGRNCGEIDDGCGVAISCGGCAAAETCGLLENNVCGCASDEWIVEEDVDPALDVGGYPAIAVAPTGEIHLSYLGDWALRHAVRSVEGEWSTEIVDTGVAWETSVAVDQRGELHIVYFKFDAEDLLHAHKPPGGDWEFEVIDSGGVVWNVSLGIDRSDQLHVVYFDRDDRTVRYGALPLGGVWLTMPIGASDDPSPSLAVDADGTVHVSFRGADDTIQYATRSSGEWDIAPVDPDGGLATSIAVDSSGTPHIAFDAYVGFGLDYADGSAGSWRAETVPGTTASIADPSIVVGGDGTIHILYAETGNSSYREARRATDGSWQILDVAPPGLGTSYNPQLVQDDRGNLHAVFGKTADNRSSVRYGSACVADQ